MISIPRATGAVNSPQLRVLRNTYALLALSMLPTIAGAWFGLSTGILAAMGPWVTALVMLGVGFGLIFAIQANRNNAAGVPCLLVFTFFMGVMLSSFLGFVLHRQQGAELIALAFACTASIFGGMALLASVVKRDLSGLNQALFIGLILLIVAGVANIFLHSSVLQLALAVIGALIFTVYILVDLKAVRDGTETSYISATLNIYLDVINLFTNLLQLLSLGSDD